MTPMSKQIQVYVKVYTIGDEFIVAACDKELLGFMIKDPGRGISLYVDPHFYGGELRDIDFLLELLSRATSANLVGKKVVEAAVSAGFIHGDAVLEVDGVLVAFFARI